MTEQLVSAAVIGWLLAGVLVAMLAVVELSADRLAPRRLGLLLAVLLWPGVLARAFLRAWLGERPYFR